MSESSFARHVTPESRDVISNVGVNQNVSDLLSGTLSELLDQGSRSMPVSPMTQLAVTDSTRRLEHQAAAIINDCWMRYRNKKMFRLIKHAVCAAEKSMSEEVLRKVSPNEAHLLSDKAIQFRVRFRFGGTEFPPQIFFKVFLHKNSSVTYVNGKKMIRPHSEAAEDSLRLMGNRTYYEHVLQDRLHHYEHGITDLVDVSTLKDYIQYCSTLDETPCKLGGRDNCWRKLSLQDLPRYCVFRDIVEFLDSRRSLTYILNAYPGLLIQPTTQQALLQHINIISSIRETSVKPRLFTSLSRTTASDPSHSSRRSNRTMERSEKMKNVYLSQFGDHQEITREETLDVEDDDDDWEQDASRLYQWSQRLTYDDVTISQALLSQ